MSFKDYFNPTRGHFIFRTFNADGTMDEYTDKNLIMDTARSNMAKHICGLTTASIINKFVLGTMGHVNTILEPKIAGENGFIPSRIKLFSEETAGGGLNYRIAFNTSSAGTSITDSSAVGDMYDGNVLSFSDDTSYNTVQRVISGNTVTYTIDIPLTNANSIDINNPTIAFTEAALYAGTEIFSMKTFPARVKENTVRFQIIWTIIF